MVKFLLTFLLLCCSIIPSYAGQRRDSCYPFVYTNDFLISVSSSWKYQYIVDYTDPLFDLTVGMLSDSMVRTGVHPGEYIPAKLTSLVVLEHSANPNVKMVVMASGPCAMSNYVTNDDIFGERDI